MQQLARSSQAARRRLEGLRLLVARQPVGLLRLEPVLLQAVQRRPVLVLALRRRALAQPPPWEGRLLLQPRRLERSPVPQAVREAARVVPPARVEAVSALCSAN